MKHINQVCFTILRTYFAEATLQPDCNAPVFPLETKVQKIYIPISIQRQDFSNDYKYSFFLLILELWDPWKPEVLCITLWFWKEFSFGS